MDKIMEKLSKLSLPAAILMASLILGGFFYATQVSKQRSIERQQQIKIEQEQQDKKEAEQALNTCIDNAYEMFKKGWRYECEELGSLTNRCIELNEMTLSEYLEQNHVQDLTVEEALKVVEDFDKEKKECFCELPIYKTDSIGNRLEKNKMECFKKYP